MSAERHDLLRKVAHPSAAGLDGELTFRVQQHAAGEYGEQSAHHPPQRQRPLARAAFDAAVRCYPDECWFLLWGSHVVAKYAPDRRDSDQALPKRHHGFRVAPGIRASDRCW
jgi:hypothetical protein